MSFKTDTAGPGSSESRKYEVLSPLEIKNAALFFLLHSIHSSLFIETVVFLGPRWESGKAALLL